MTIGRAAILELFGGNVAGMGPDALTWQSCPPMAIFPPAAPTAAEISVAGGQISRSAPAIPPPLRRWPKFPPGTRSNRSFSSCRRRADGSLSCAVPPECCAPIAEDKTFAQGTNCSRAPTGRLAMAWNLLSGAAGVSWTRGKIAKPASRAGRSSRRRHVLFPALFRPLLSEPSRSDPPICRKTGAAGSNALSGRRLRLPSPQFACRYGLECLKKSGFPESRS